MAWGFRRSLKIAGPLRLNFSKSGLGLSLGVPGLHVGVGPRGRYLRAGVPGTGVYYRKSLSGPKPKATRQPAQKHLDSPWMKAVTALLENRPEECLRLLENVRAGRGPAVHIEVEDDVVVTISPDACGVAVLRAEAFERLGRKTEALDAVRSFAAGCRVAQIVAEELQR